MSAFDIYVRNNVVYPILPAVFLLIILYFGKGYLMKLRKRAFAYFMNKMTDQYNKEADSIKRKLFNPMNDVVSRDWKLRNEGLIRILELGIGTGANLKYFPKGCRLIAVDWNSEMKPVFLENCKKYPHVNTENFIVAPAEDMSAIEDDSIDVVVCTLLLCSADNVKRILQEIKRVLVQGGKFVFLEHVHAEPTTILSKVQSFLTVTKIWPILCLGCELNRHTGDLIEKAGFSEVSFERINIGSGRIGVISFIRSHIGGFAVK
ncbi:methyltransferase-like protein 7A [Ischnura elegans]|uniref:methyltransferase-like protein 7A n=1 Tax=Ischnura elegans TaxID=197161 RepID=UPI001ED86C46|nr:methyltransferase-like protein 7A [Ischnura elegans]